MTLSCFLCPLITIQISRGKLARWYLKTRKATALWNGRRTRVSAAARPGQQAQVEPANTIIVQSTPLPARQVKDPWAERFQESKENQRPAGNTLRTSTGTVVRNSSIRQKIIGHGFAAAGSCFGRGRLLRPEDRHLALSNPPCQVGCGIFVEPLIEKRRYLLPQIGGVAQAGTRPVIVVTRDAINRHSPVVVVIPLTNKISRGKPLPSHVETKMGEGGLTADSVALCEQVRAISITRLTRALGHLSATTISQLNGALKTALDLP